MMMRMMVVPGQTNTPRIANGFLPLISKWICLEAFKQIELPKLSEANSKAKVCPLYSCFQPFPTVAALKTHIAQQHPELTANGMEIDNNGAITYPDHIFDSVLMTVKIFPNFVSSYVLEEGKKLASVQDKTDGNKN